MFVTYVFLTSSYFPDSLVEIIEHVLRALSFFSTGEHSNIFPYIFASKNIQSKKLGLVFAVSVTSLFEDWKIKFIITFPDCCRGILGL